MPAHVKKPINLLPPSEFEQSFWGKFLKWAVTAGRYVTILTELVVILAFLFRFKLDTEVADLGTRIEGQKNFLEAQAAVEERFRSTQKRMVAVEAALTKQLKASEVADRLTQIKPEGMRFDQLQIRKGEVSIQALAVSETEVNRFLLALGTSSNWKGADLQEVSSEGEGGVKFLLTVKY